MVSFLVEDWIVAADLQAGQLNLLLVWFLVYCFLLLVD